MATDAKMASHWNDAVRPTKLGGSGDEKNAALVRVFSYTATIMTRSFLICDCDCDLIVHQLAVQCRRIAQAKSSSSRMRVIYHNW